MYPINNISHLTTEVQPISDHEKKSKPSPKEKKTRTKLKLSSKMIEWQPHACSGTCAVDHLPYHSLRTKLWQRLALADPKPYSIPSEASQEYLTSSPTKVTEFKTQVWKRLKYMSWLKSSEQNLENLFMNDQMGNLRLAPMLSHESKWKT